MNFVFFVEGHTERKVVPQFVKRWLDPKLKERVGVRTVRFNGWNQYYDDIGKKVALNLSGASGRDVIAAIGLLDLYGPTFYPAGIDSASERYAWAKATIQARVGNKRFRQHFAVHDLEAWLLADPSLFPAEVRRAFPPKVGEPENVNFREPPASLLERTYFDRLGRGYRKIIDGTNLFLALDPDTAYRKCPCLRALLDDLLSLAQAAGL